MTLADSMSEFVSTSFCAGKWDKPCFCREPIVAPGPGAGARNAGGGLCGPLIRRGEGGPGVSLG